MLPFVLQPKENVTSRMQDLKTAGIVKSATCRQLMGEKLMLQKFLDLYRMYGLIG